MPFPAIPIRELIPPASTELLDGDARYGDTSGMVTVLWRLTGVETRAREKGGNAVASVFPLEWRAFATSRWPGSPTAVVLSNTPGEAGTVIVRHSTETSQRATREAALRVGRDAARGRAATFGLVDPRASVTAAQYGQGWTVYAVAVAGTPGAGDPPVLGVLVDASAVRLDTRAPVTLHDPDLPFLPPPRVDLARVLNRNRRAADYGEDENGRRAHWARELGVQPADVPALFLTV